MNREGDFHLHFVSKNQTFDVDFQESAHASKDTVLLNGRNYALQGDSFKIAWLKAKLPQLTQSGLSSDELLARLVQLGATHISSTAKIHHVGIDFFRARISTPETSQVGKWMAKEATLPAQRMKVAEKYWSIHSDRFKEIAKMEAQIEILKAQGEPSLNAQIAEYEEKMMALKKPDAMFINFLKGKSIKPETIAKTFYAAARNQDRDLFRSLFVDLSLADLQSIDLGERLNVLPIIPKSHSPVTLTEEDIKNIRDYMRDSHFSGVVTISDGWMTRSITSQNIQDPNTPFAIHSVGKVFTGVLALRLIEEGKIPEKALDEPIKLNQEVMDALPPKVREQLSKTTLREVMWHQGRYGDYLEKYQAAIERALSEGTPVPKIEKPEDFLQFADAELAELGPSGDSYSNLGLVLVGLSLQHLYNVNQNGHLNYQEILNQFVLEPAGIKTFETHMPKNGCINPEERDKAPPHIVGGPAGGYWSTTADLLRMGEWLGKKCKDERFMALMDKYGREFYRNRNGEISHGGSIESASAHFSHNLRNGMTIAIVSNTTGPGKASALNEIIQENVLASDEKKL